MVGTLVFDMPFQCKGGRGGFIAVDWNLLSSERVNVFTQEPDKAKELFSVLKADLARGRSR